MSPSFLIILVALAAVFVALTGVRVFGARRHMRGLIWLAAGAGCIALGAAMRLWPLALLGAGLVGWGLWVRRRPAPSAQDAAFRKAAGLLGVSIDADAEAVRQAFRQKLAAAHPDRGGTDAQARQLIAARDLLLNRKS